MQAPARSAGFPISLGGCHWGKAPKNLDRALESAEVGSARQSRTQREEKVLAWWGNNRLGTFKKKKEIRREELTLK